VSPHGHRGAPGGTGGHRGAPGVFGEEGAFRRRLTPSWDGWSWAIEKRPRSAAGTRRTTARCRRARTAGIFELSGATATIDGVLPPAAVRRQRYGSAWHLGFAPEIHELPTHLAEPVVQPGLLAPPDHRAPAFSWPFSLGGPWRSFLPWWAYLRFPLPFEGERQGSWQIVITRPGGGSFRRTWKTVSS